ncbi:MAG: host attachment protein [Candidatus Komeilibacteria bacterium]|nr:host attachment protein [Candidatus Komeilibacteria bacterium]
MQISNKYPQFDKSSALLIVTGRQEAKIYLATKGTIEEIDNLKVSNPRYSDREGFFMNSGGGKTLGSGSVYEDHHEDVIKEFLKDLENDLVEMDNKHQPEQYYLFTPDYMAKQVRDSLPNGAENKVKLVVQGNYVKEHPFTLLDKINQ